MQNALNINNRSFMAILFYIVSSEAPKLPANATIHPIDLIRNSFGATLLAQFLLAQPFWAPFHERNACPCQHLLVFGMGIHVNLEKVPSHGVDGKTTGITA
jgi:hypothetical protein